jgi:hypothetical protein
MQQAQHKRKEEISQRFLHPFPTFQKEKNKSFKYIKSLRVGNICRVMQIILQNFA